MSKWDIQPAGVRRVLDQTATVANAFESLAANLATAIDGAGAESSSGIVVAALGEFAAGVKTDMTFMNTRTVNCLTAASKATTAYLQGDLEMAANAQSAAAAAPDPYAVMPGRGKQPAK